MDSVFFGWEAGRRAERLASFGNGYPALANSFQRRELAGISVFVLLPLFVCIGRECQHNDTRNGTRREVLDGRRGVRPEEGS